jgi:hypothetical protein
MHQFGRAECKAFMTLTLAYSRKGAFDRNANSGKPIKSALL